MNDDLDVGLTTRVMRREELVRDAALLAATSDDAVEVRVAATSVVVADRFGRPLTLTTDVTIVLRSGTRLGLAVAPCPSVAMSVDWPAPVIAPSVAAGHPRTVVAVPRALVDELLERGCRSADAVSGGGRDGTAGAVPVPVSRLMSNRASASRDPSLRGTPSSRPLRTPELSRAQEVRTCRLGRGRDGVTIVGRVPLMRVRTAEDGGGVADRAGGKELPTFRDPETRAEGSDAGSAASFAGDGSDQESSILTIAVPAEGARGPRDLRGRYETYLRSHAWRCSEARLAELRAAEGRCRLCGRGAPGVRLEVHHRSYERLGCERVSDLCTVCSDCHDVVTGELRRRRFATAALPPRADTPRVLPGRTPPRSDWEMPDV